jgi:transcriptional regulator with XRE-family HTH domain
MGNFFRLDVPSCGPEWAGARQRAKLRQIDLARRLGVTTRTIRNLERDRGSGVSLAIRRLALAEIRLELLHHHEGDPQ